ncbi:uncharacterized protein [Eurosta solidaginis]|uniref:uncharacterized protein n=1 Tax=Eurosta solidaginis TaxID=178769 RepID=UPI0035315FAB
MYLENSKQFAVFKSTKARQDFVEAIMRELASETSIKGKEGLEEKIGLQYIMIERKWKVVYRNNSKFLSKHEKWLADKTFLDEETPSTSTNPTRARPTKPIEECSTYTKKSKLSDTTKAMATTHLSEALAIKYKKDEENVKSHITEAVALASPVRLMSIKNSIPTPPNALPRKYTPEEALALFIDIGLTMKKYIILRKSLLERNADIVLGYKKITQAKKEAVPLNPKITEVSAEIELQNLMDHTSTRLLQSFTEEKLKSLPKELAMITKWGCDGSSGQSAYKQRINVDDETITDSNMFMASIVPLRLKEYWKNPRPSSTILCRPILFKYEKESSELIKATTGMSLQ